MVFKKGFTIIELLVVIAIIAVLAAIIISNVTGYVLKARDARRKQDLHNIALALDMYYAQNGSYPSTGSTTPNGTTVYSTQDPNEDGNPDDWIELLKNPDIIGSIPIDPINSDEGPWCFGGHNTKNTIYTYTSNGQHYVLCAWMENTSDPQTLQYNDVPNPWNTAQGLYANYNYSKYNYIISK